MPWPSLRQRIVVDAGCFRNRAISRHTAGRQAWPIAEVEREAPATRDVSVFRTRRFEGMRVLELEMGVADEDVLGWRYELAGIGGFSVELGGLRELERRRQH